MFLYAKQIINIGKRIEEIETKMRCIQTNVNWFKKCANDMDILLDEEEMYFIFLFFRIIKLLINFIL